jgi:hypothetical protein
MLFSATVPPEVIAIARDGNSRVVYPLSLELLLTLRSAVLLPGYSFIQTIPEDSVGTVENVTQKVRAASSSFPVSGR